MKKMLFVVALGVAGLLCAKGTVKSKKSVIKPIVKKSLVMKTPQMPSQWVECHSPCGKVYWLQASNYNTPAELLDAQQEFNDIKCG